MSELETPNFNSSPSNTRLVDEKGDFETVSFSLDTDFDCQKINLDGSDLGKRMKISTSSSLGLYALEKVD